MPRIPVRPLDANLGTCALNTADQKRQLSFRLMTRNLRRFHESKQSYLLTFSCYRRQLKFDLPAAFNLFVQCLEDMRKRFRICVYGSW